MHPFDLACENIEDGFDERVSLDLFGRRRSHLRRGLGLFWWCFLRRSRLGFDNLNLPPMTGRSGFAGLIALDGLA